MRLRPWILAATLALAAPAAMAAPQPADLQFSLGGASDYVFRGVSQTEGRAQAFAAADLGHGIFYAGAWLSNVRFGGREGAEFDLYGGLKPQWGPVALDLGLIAYGYSHRPQGGHDTYAEAKASGSLPLGRATLGLAAYYSPDDAFRPGPAAYYELNGAMALDDHWSVSGAMGRREVRGPSDYSTWNLGVGYAPNPRVGFDLRYWDTDRPELGRAYRSRVAIGLKATF